LENEDFRPPFVFDDVEGIKMRNLNLPANNNIVIKSVKDISVDEGMEKQVLKVK
jgi:hypothetical protein